MLNKFRASFKQAQEKLESGQISSTGEFITDLRKIITVGYSDPNMSQSGY